MWTSYGDPIRDQSVQLGSGFHEHAEHLGSVSMVVDPLRILAIEDDPDTRENLCDILRLDGHSVESAANVRDTLARDDWAEIAAILLDRRLPDGSADSLLPQLRQLAPEAAIVVITGYADLEGALAALREGASDYILKPVNPDALRASLMRIARIKQAERQARQAERLAAIGQVLTMLAHETRGVLQRSQASLEMLAWDLAGKADLLALVHDALEAQQRLHRLFEDVRCYAAPIHLKREPADLEEILEEAWSSLGLRRAGRTIRLRKESVQAHVSCAVDRLRIEQVFRNILENSLAACQDPVEIEMQSSRVDIDGCAVLQIRFRDNGPGIRPEDRKGIFQPFFTTKPEGTGLGLVISKLIIEAHGGRIDIGEEPGGAEFVITLPLAGAQTLEGCAQPGL